MAGRGSPNPADPSFKRGYSLRSRGQIVESLEDVDSHIRGPQSSTNDHQTVHVLNTSGSRNSNKRSSLSSSHHSSAILTRDVQQQAQEKIMLLTKEELKQQRSIQDLETDISRLGVRVTRLRNDHLDISIENEDGLRISRKKIAAFEDELLEKNIMLKALMSQLKITLDMNMQEKEMILSKQVLEQDKILENEDQFLGTDGDEMDIRVTLEGDQEIYRSNQMNSYLTQVQAETLRVQDASEIRRKELEDISKQRESEAESVRQKRLLLEQQTEEIKKLLHIAKNEAIKANEEAKHSQEESDRKVAEKLQTQVNLEEQLQKLTQSTRTIVAEEKPVVSQQITGQVDERLLQLFSQVIDMPRNSNRPPPDTNKFLARQSHAKELPFFNGNPEEWLTFYSAFTRTTKICEFSDDENLNRLMKCLKGDAIRAVQTLMTTPQNVGSIIKTLEMRFGQPEFIIKAMIQKVKKLQPVKEDRLESLIVLGEAVSGLIRTLQALSRSDHLKNPTLLEELLDKIPISYKMAWRDWLRNNPAKEKDTTSFAEWLQMKTEDACAICPPKSEISDRDERKDEVHGRQRVRRQGEHVLSIDDQQRQRQQKKDKPDNRDRKCSFCGETGHRLQQCRSFQAAEYEGRNKHARDKKLCFGCLNYGHSYRDCRGKKTCGKDGCHDMHHPLLHNSYYKEGFKSNNSPAAELPKVKEQDPPKLCGFADQDKRVTDEPVGLWILPAKVEGPNGVFKIYVMLDSGSTISLIQETLAGKLGLIGIRKDLHMVGIHQTAVKNSMEVNFKIFSEDGQRTFALKSVRTVDHLPLPPQTIDVNLLKRWKHLKNLNIQSFQNETPVLLIGQDHANLITPIRKICGPGSAPMAVRTELGWTVGGSSNNIPTTNGHSFYCYESRREYEELHHLVKMNFTTEDLGVKLMKDESRSKDEKLAQDILDQTMVLKGGQYETGLLWKPDSSTKPDGYGNAYHRLQSMESKMDKNSDFALQYQAKIQEYLDKGFAKKLNSEEVKGGGERTFYIPHFMVYNIKKPNKSRFVFDCAATVAGGTLNDRLLKGPDKLRPLPSILKRFCQRKVALTGDIEDMFHRVKVRKQDRSVQRFLWRGMDRDRTPDVLEMEVLIFGATCSPACAIEAMNKNAQRYQDKYPEAVKAIQVSTYMDDFGDSFDSVEEAVQRRCQVQEIHAAGGFHIHKWGSNSPEVMATIPSDLRAAGMKRMETDTDMEVERILGLFWKPDEDYFTFRGTFLKIEDDILRGDRVPTKTELLSLGMSVYDPLGFLAHFLIKARIMMQETWRWQIGWKDEIPKSIHERWFLWLEELKRIHTFKLPRCYSPNLTSADEIQLHIFCDASEQAFGAIAYFRVVKGKQVEICFITAKAKVAPLKCLSIPRCELQAALVGSRLASHLKGDFDITINRTIFWTDSRTVYYWITADGKRFHTFVSHRIGEIQELTDSEDWKWVPGKENVADELTRDNSPCDWSPESRWINGPTFLKSPEEDWPKIKPKLDKDELKSDIFELKKDYAFMVTVKTADLISVSRFSSWSKLLRTVAYLLKFIKHCRSKDKDKLSVSHQLYPDEIQIAELLLWKMAQRESYLAEIESLEWEFPMERRSSLLKLKPFLHSDGVMRVNGRLSNAKDLEFTVKHPVILHPKHPFTRLILSHYHVKGGHHGQERVVNDVRQKFYIPHIRTAVKTTWTNCQVCKNNRVQPSVPEMGQLPAYRLTAYDQPFANTGLDYFGPIEVTVGRKHEKRYGALFTCLSSRAVHIEIANSLSTDSCIMAIRRFTSRRGEPKNIYSDNGTNFVGARNELQQALLYLNQDQMIQQCTAKGIHWHFNPPAAPHMGGSWERLVRSVKTALYSTLIEVYPKEEIFRTLMAEAEHIVNSHPLTRVSSDPDDLEAITPNHILIGRSCQMQPIGLFGPDDMSSRTMWKKTERLADVFWDRWTKEYLPTLLNRVKWHKPSKPVEIGDVVLVVDLNTPRGSWPKGIIKSIFPGKDGHVRVAEVQTAHGLYKRPVVKLAVLDVGKCSSPENDAKMSLETVMPVVTRAAIKKMGNPNCMKDDQKILISCLELPMAMAKRLNLVSLRQEVESLRKSGWHKRILADYLREFTNKRKKVKAANKVKVN